jgi:RimJ/RimL family protein N-acetyltransferase
MIRTERLLLRRWREEDREPFAAMNADPRVMRYFPACQTREESNALVDRAEAHFDRHGFGPFAVELCGNGEFVGFIGLVVPAFQAHFTPCVEIGWRLAAAYWNQGLATEGALACVRYGFDAIGLEEIVSFTVPDNIASRRVMEKIGMRRDEADDFDHPKIPDGHHFRRHVLYRLTRTMV